MTVLICQVSLLIFGLLSAGLTEAQTRGIGVTPANIEVQSMQEWPFAAPLFVTNFSSQEELFEITFDRNMDTIVSADPGRFVLEGGDTGRILLTFENPNGTSNGIIRIASARTLPEGLTTGTGIEVPFSISSDLTLTKPEQSVKAGLLAGALDSAGGFIQYPRIVGAFAIFGVVILLWYIATLGSKLVFIKKEKS